MQLTCPPRTRSCTLAKGSNPSLSRRTQNVWGQPRSRLVCIFTTRSTECLIFVFSSFEGSFRSSSAVVIFVLISCNSVSMHLFLSSKALIWSIALSKSDCSFSFFACCFFASVSDLAFPSFNWRQRLIYLSRSSVMSFNCFWVSFNSFCRLSLDWPSSPVPAPSLGTLSFSFNSSADTFGSLSSGCSFTSLTVLLSLSARSCCPFLLLETLPSALSGFTNTFSTFSFTVSLCSPLIRIGQSFKAFFAASELVKPTKQ